MGVHDDGLELRVTTPNGHEQVRLPFGPGAVPADLRSRVAALVRAARASTGDRPVGDLP